MPRHVRPLRPKQGGLTLIEVMVAVAILGILVAVAMPSYTQYVARGKRAEGRTALLGLLQQQQKFFAANNAYTADLAGNGFATRSGDDPAHAAYDLSAAACGGTTAALCVVLSAAPRFSDAECGTLSISTAGARDSSVAGAADRCWQR